MRFGWLLLAATLLACRASDESSACAPGAACVRCPVGTLEGADGACTAVGVRAEHCAPELPFDAKTSACEPVLPAMECPPGSMPRLGSASCTPVGVAECGEGFELDGTGGCRASLPKEACVPGTFAIPGDAACRPPAECAAGPYGDLPSAALTFHVDGSYAGATSDGSAASPYKKIQDAIDAAQKSGSADALVAVAAGTYGENLTIAAPLRLFGVCTEKVVVHGTGDKPAIEVSAQATLHGIAVTADRVGVFVSGQLVLERAWVHDTGWVGVHVQSSLARHAEARITRSLIEKATTNGVLVQSSKLTVDQSEIRDTGESPSSSFTSAGILVPPETGFGDASLEVNRSVLSRNAGYGIGQFGFASTITATLVRDSAPTSDGLYGVGLIVRDHATSHVPSTADVRGSVFDHNAMDGVYVIGSKATLTDCVVRDTQSTRDGRYGDGVTGLADKAAKFAGEITLDHVLVEGNHDGGAVAFGAKLSLRSVLVRNTLPRAKDKTQGSGVGGQISDGFVPEIDVSDSLIDASHMAGVLLNSANAKITGSVVRGTLPMAKDSRMGRGIVAQDEPTAKVASSLELSTSLVEKNLETGVLLLGSTATIDASVIRDTSPEVRTKTGGIGIVVASSADTGIAASLTVTRSLVERCRQGGIYVSAAPATIETTLVRDVLAQLSDGLLGRGIAVQHDASATAASLVLRDATIERTLEAGLSIVGASATLERAWIRATHARESDGAFGDGVIVYRDGDLEGTLELKSCLVQDSARAGVSVFGGSLSLESSTVACAAFDIDAETLEEHPYALTDLGRNVCGCGAPAACVARSARLAPIAPMPPPPTR